MVKSQIEQLLGIDKLVESSKSKTSEITFSFLFFSDVREDISDAEKYNFMKKVTLFADKEGFEAIYIPERHFYQFGSIYANSAIVAAYLIPQTQRIRFRTAGITIPLHHPAEIVEWWAMNDVLSGGRVDLGFGSGWNKADFILAPDNYNDRKKICSENISIIRKLWRGESVDFIGPDGEKYPTKVFPKPIQPEINVWLLIAQNDEAFIHAGKEGYNIFTMLYGNNLEIISQKIALYRKACRESGYINGKVTLMLHTCVHDSLSSVELYIEGPFKEYIKSALLAHTKAYEASNSNDILSGEEKDKMLDYAYQRYLKTAGIFGTVEDGKKIVDQAIAAGVNEIACLVDFGVDYDFVMSSLPYLKSLVSHYRKGNK